MISRPDVKLKIIEALNDVGILVDEEDFDVIDLREYEMDSIMFVSFVVNLEEEFGINVPDEYLSLNQLANLNSVQYIIEELIKEKE